MTPGVFKVKFNGESYFWLRDENGSGPLAPLHHLDEDREIKPEFAFSGSFAHVTVSGEVFQYRKVIGYVEQIEFVPEYEDWGAWNKETGDPLIKVRGSPPSLGQYSFCEITGQYTFHEGEKNPHYVRRKLP